MRQALRPPRWPASVAFTTRADGYATAVLLTVAGTWLAAVVLGSQGPAASWFADAGVYYDAGQAALAGADPYVPPLDIFRQWPLVASLCAPLTLFSRPLAARLFALLSIGAVALGVYCLRRRLAREGAQPGQRWLVAVALGPPTLEQALTGQMSGLCFGVYALGLSLRNRPVLSGLCFALLAAKPHLALLALPALLASPPAALVTFVLGALCWPLGSVLVDGPARTAEFITLLVRLRATDGGFAFVASAPAYLVPATWHLRAVVELASGLAVAAVLATLALRRLRRGVAPNAAAIDALSVAVYCAIPYVQLYDLLFLLPAVLRLGRLSPRPRLWLIGAWWALPFLGIALLRVGGGDAAGLLPPLLLLLMVGHGRARLPGRGGTGILHSARRGVAQLG